MKTVLAIVLLMLSFSVMLAAQVPASGRIKGTLTYHFNETYGSKPDVGSEIWIVGGRVEVSETGQIFDFRAQHTELVVNTDYGTPEQKTTRYKVLKYTIADGSGNFEILVACTN